MQVTPAYEVLNFAGLTLLPLLSLLWFIYHFSLSLPLSICLHCLISLGHFSLMSDHVTISIGSFYLTPGSLSPELWKSVHYHMDPILCALGVLLSVLLCQWSKDSSKVSCSSKELNHSSVGVLQLMASPLSQKSEKSRLVIPPVLTSRCQNVPSGLEVIQIPVDFVFLSQLWD